MLNLIFISVNEVNAKKKTLLAEASCCQRCLVNSRASLDWM